MITEFWLTTILTVLAILVTVALFMLGHLITSARARTAKWEQLDRRLNEMEKQIRILQTQVSPFWAALQTEITEALHHPHPEAKEMDELLEKLEALTITPAERVNLKARLMALLADPIVSLCEKSRASALLIVMPLVQKERIALLEAARMQMATA